MRRKLIILLLFCACYSASSFAQVLKYTKVTNGDLNYVLNNIEKSIKFQNSTGDLFIKVYVVSDPSGSANIPETEEITNTIYIATSEDGEAADEYLYKLTSVYDPKIISWTKSAKHPQLIFSYGPADKRKKVDISIELKNLAIKQLL